MNSPFDQISDTIYYYVDEAGDPNLFTRRGRVIVGNEGCSNFFILGKLDIFDPPALERALNQLRAELVANPYFKNVPSMQPQNNRTAVAFHATNDLPEVRWEVFKALQRQETRLYAVVRDKRRLLADIKERNERDPSYRYKDDQLYDTLVRELFGKLRRTADSVNICFAKRGNKERTKALEAALEEAETEFERDFGFRRDTHVSVTASTPRDSAGLQAVDYYLWALQRFYERGEDRFIEMLWPQVGEVYDLDLKREGRRGVYFLKDNPLNSETRPLK